jgi:hypothetical protein
MSSRIEALRARLSRKGDPGEWTDAMMMAAITEHEAELARIKGLLDAGRSDIPPPEIADLIRLNETYKRTIVRLVEGYRDAMQRAEIARTRDGTFEGKSTTEWLRKAERYDSAIKWNRGRNTDRKRGWVWTMVPPAMHCYHPQLRNREGQDAHTHHHRSSARASDGTSMRRT